MAQQFSELSDRLIDFINKQHLFFVATATAKGHVNVSPKGMDSLRILNSRCISWLNVTGSGNETAAHIKENARMTLMFCAFEGKPLILRVYGKARAVHPYDAEWKAKFAMFDPLPGARQIFILDIDLVQTSCGMAVPYFDFVGDREQLNNWAERKGKEGIQEYWRENNQFSLDGIATDIIKKNG